MNFDSLQEINSKNYYNYGFITDIESEIIKKGINENVIKIISIKKNEPFWLLEWRLRAYKYFERLLKGKKEPNWPNFKYSRINYNDVIYYSAPKKSSDLNVSNKILKTYNKLGVSIEQKKVLSNIAIDAVFDSVSVVTTFKNSLREKGIIFCSFSEAIQRFPDLVKRYLGSVVHYDDNFFVALNSAVFSDGSFCFVPKGVKCPMELSTYFRINSANIGQFERTLIVVEDRSYVSYLEGCSASIRNSNQLHAAVVEIISLNESEVKYSTVQNWYPGNLKGGGGIYNFVTKRGLCKGNRSKISWIQIETGSALTWKYPSVVLFGDYSNGEFYSIALSSNFQQADTGTKMIHIGKYTKSIINSKGISMQFGKNAYRGMVKILGGALGARNYTQCDSLLFGNKCSAHAFPLIDVKNNSSKVEHEASASKISSEQLFYCQQRGIVVEEAVSLIVRGFCKTVFQKLPMQFVIEAEKLININIDEFTG